MRSVLFASILLTSVTAAAAATDAELQAMIVGTWADDGGCDQDNIAFHADGTFAGGYVGYQVGGTYQIVNGQLLGKHDKVQPGDAPDGVLPPVSVRFDGGRLVLFDPGNGDNGDNGLARCK